MSVVLYDAIKLNRPTSCTTHGLRWRHSNPFEDPVILDHWRKLHLRIGNSSPGSRSRQQANYQQ